MLKQKSDIKLILASGSPRRRELLAGCGLTFEVVVSEVDEEILPSELPEDMVRRLSLAKANSVARRYPEAFVLGADTTVVVNGAILGKPSDELDAQRMLSIIQGTTHQVWGGFALVCDKSKYKVVESHSTDVAMIRLSREMIKDYVTSGEPLDKAGAYAIQGIGESLVERVNGSYTNVVGLNLASTIAALRRAEIVI